MLPGPDPRSSGRGHGVQRVALLSRIVRQRRQGTKAIVHTPHIGLALQFEGIKPGWPPVRIHPGMSQICLASLLQAACKAPAHTVACVLSVTILETQWKESWRAFLRIQIYAARYMIDTYTNLVLASKLAV